MERITVTWGLVLNITFEVGRSKSKEIADAVKVAVLNQILLLGSDVPPYRLVAVHMGLKRSVVAKAWRILVVDHKLFESASGGGTRIVSLLPGMLPLPSPVKRRAGHGHILRFDMETIGHAYTGSIKLTQEMAKTVNSLPALELKQLREAEVPGMGMQLAILVNENISACYREEQIFYAQGLPFLIYNICTEISPSKKIVIMTKPASGNLVEAVYRAGKQVRFIDSDHRGMKTDQLEIACKENPVAFVYLNTRCLITGTANICPERIKELLVLQDRYKFVIIEDDCHVGFYQATPNMLMEQVKGKNAKVLYLCPVSLLGPNLYRTYVMAGPVKLVAAVRNKCLFMGGLGAVNTLIVLKDIMERKVLRKVELKMKKYLPDLNARAYRILKESGLWEAKGISPAVGWYFFLKPIKGSFPANITETLLRLHFAVVDSTDYLPDLPVEAGIMISVANYLGSDKLETDLLKLSSTLKSLIIIN